MKNKVFYPASLNNEKLQLICQVYLQFPLPSCCKHGVPPFQKGGNLKKIWGWGKPKGGRFSKMKRGLYKLNLGIEKNQNGDF